MRRWIGRIEARVTRWHSFLARNPRVVICGRSNVGKSTLARLATDRLVYNTGVIGIDGDTPTEIDFKATPYWWLDRLEKTYGPWLLEGTQGSRIVRAGLRDLLWEPDGVAHVLGVYDPRDLPPDERSGDEAEDYRRASVLASRAAWQESVWRDYLMVRAERWARSELMALTLDGWLAEVER